MSLFSSRAAAFSNADKKNIFTELLPYVWLLLPAFILFRTVITYSVNIPMLDDYDAILDFLSHFKTATTQERLSLLFAQHNEHRIVTSRILYLAYYTLAGNVNFETLLLINNLLLIPTFFIGTYFIKKFIPNHWYIPAFIFSLCLFDVSNYENSYFVMAGIQNYGVYMWFMLSLYFYSLQGNKHLWLPVLLQVLCIFSSGNGMIGALALTGYNILNGNKTKAIVAASTFILFSSLYFIGYEQPPTSHGIAATEDIIPFFLHEVGARFGYEQGILAGALILALLLVTFPATKKLKLHANAAPLCAMLSFALLSLAAAALYRATNKMTDSYASRYFIHSGMITAILFCFIIHKVWLKKIFWPALSICIALIFYAYSYNYKYGISCFEREHYRKELLDYYYDEAHPGRAKKIADRACSEGIYCLEEERQRLY